MGAEREIEIKPSTHWEWKHVKIDPPLAAPTRTASKSPKRPVLSQWSGRNHLTIQVRYRGGAECWYEIKARGRVWRVTGDTDLHSTMEAIYGRGVTDSRE